MKKKMILAGATLASIVAPIAAVVSCGSNTHHSLNYDASKPLVKGNTILTGKSFFEEKDAYKETFNSNLSKYDKQILFTLYDKEVVDAYKLQLGDFDFKVFKNEQEKTKVTGERDTTVTAHDTATDDATKKALQSKIDAKNKRIQSLTKTLSELKDKIKEIKDKKIDFDSSSFGSKFPLLLKPFANIKKDKEKYFEDQKAQHMKTFGPNEGAKKWPEEMKKKFGGSETREDAIIWLASSQIRNYAKGAYTFRINNSYTVEQYIWAVVSKNQNWKFLSDDKDHSKRIHINFSKPDKTKIDTELKKKDIKDVAWGLIDSIKDKKVFFISSNGKSVIPFGKDEGAFITAEVGKTPLIKVQNGIIPFVRDANPNKAWSIKEAQLKTLLHYYGDGRQGFEYFFDDNMYKTDDFTTMALHMGTTDSTSDIQGSLGIKETLDYVKTMKPGFGLGVLEIKYNTLSNKVSGATMPISGATMPIISGAAMKTAIVTKLKALFARNNITPPKSGDTTTTKNEEIDKLFEAMKKEIEPAFGGAIRDYFKTIDKPNGGGSLAYTIGSTTNHIVLSTFGIHVIHTIDTTTAPGDVSADLENMSKEQKVSSSTGITSLINSKYAKNYLFYEKVLSDSDLKSKLKAKLKSYGNKNDLSIEKLEEMIKRIKASEITKKIASSLGVVQINWYKTQLDNKLKNSKLTIDNIYEMAKAVNK